MQEGGKGGTIFSVMNVKTAHKGYPKDELLAFVGEIKGKGAAKRAERRERRGLSVASQCCPFPGKHVVYTTVEFF